MEKRIKNHEDYGITDDGRVISYKYKKPKEMSAWTNMAGYQYVSLCENNIAKHYAVHRLVAEAFIPNPDNLPEVNHKDKNKSNNKLENLEWCDRKYNLYDSYSTMGPARNQIKCALVQISTNSIIKIFDNKKAAAEYAKEYFDCSISSLRKYGHCKDYRIDVV